MAAQILKFSSRAELLHLRGMRNYCRWMAQVKGRVAAHSPEYWQWKDEAFAEQKADAEWAKRHGPVERGAGVAQFPSPGVRSESAQRPRSPRRARRG